MEHFVKTNGTHVTRTIAEAVDAHVRVRSRHTCRFCGKVFCIPDHLIGHYRTHAKEKSLFCFICKNAFSEKGSLKKHMRKPYFCCICKKGFWDKGNVIVHYRCHTKARQLRKCNKAFSQKCTLIHPKEKTLVSNKAFPENKNLLGEARSDSHSKNKNENPNVCGVNNEEFSLQNDFNNLSQTHREEKPCSSDV